MEKKSNLYILCLQNKKGHIVEIMHAANYDLLLYKAMNSIKGSEISYWNIFNKFGKYIDGNFPEPEDTNVA